MKVMTVKGGRCVCMCPCVCVCDLRNVVLESWSLLTNNLIFILAYLGLRTLVVMYVDTINSGAVPCLENAVTTLAQLENLAMQKAADHYGEQMAQ